MIEPVVRTLQCSCEQAFDIAADIERYPEFLRWWISAKVTQRDSSVCLVEQEVGFGPVRLKFSSTAVLQRPVYIIVTSTDAPFGCFQLRWTCTAISARACRIGVAASVEFRSGFLQFAVNRFLDATLADVAAAFERRANVLYP